MKSVRLPILTGSGRALTVVAGGLAGTGLGLLLGSALRPPLLPAFAGVAVAVLTALLLVRRSASAPPAGPQGGHVAGGTQAPSTGTRSPAHAPPANQGPLGGRRVLLLAGPDVAEGVLALLEGWGARAERLDSTPKAFARLLQGVQQGLAHDALVVELERLGLEADQFLLGLREDEALRGLRVILLGRFDSPAPEETYLRSGYSAVLRLPVDTPLLFDALHGARRDAESSSNTVSLAAYYRQRLGARRLRALVADDNPISRNVFRELLEGAGYEVHMARDGEEASAVLGRARPPLDLILLDVQMPGRSGLSVARDYRFTHPHSTTPIVMVTAEGGADVRAACRRAGADACMEKPVDPAALLAALARLMAGSVPVARRPPVPPAAGRVGEPALPPRARLDETTLDGLSRLGRDAGFLRALAEGFVREGTQSLDRIRRAFAEGDQPQFLDAVQTLRGSAGDIGAREVASLCERVLEVPAGRLDSPRVVLLVEALTRTFDATCGALGEYLDRQEDAVR